MTLLSKLDRLPPAVVRILAKHNGRLMTDAQLMAKTGWGLRRVRTVAGKGSWASVTVKDADTFLRACGLSWSAQRKQRWLLQLAINGTGLHSMRHIRFTDSKSMVAQHLKRAQKALTT